VFFKKYYKLLKVFKKQFETVFKGNGTEVEKGLVWFVFF